MIFLCRVSGGLDSLVLGEGQILAQVKQVYKVGQNCEGFGRQLNGLFKQVRIASISALDFQILHLAYGRYSQRCGATQFVRRTCRDLIHCRIAHHCLLWTAAPVWRSIESSCINSGCPRRLYPSDSRFCPYQGAGSCSFSSSISVSFPFKFFTAGHHSWKESESRDFNLIRRSFSQFRCSWALSNEATLKQLHRCQGLNCWRWEDV